MPNILVSGHLAYFDNVNVQTYKLAYAYKQQTDCSTWSTKMVDK